MHEVGQRAAQLAGVSRVLQATAPREPLLRWFRVLRCLGLLRRYDPEALQAAYSPRCAITHRIDVRRCAGAKRAALACHVSQVRGKGRASLPMRVLAALPTAVFGLLLGREWFIDSQAVVGGLVRDRIV